MADFVDKEDWRIKCRGLVDTIAEIRKRSLFVDVHFAVGQPSRLFGLHKMVLAGGSPVFEAILFGPLAERNEPIEFPDDDPDAFEIMLQHLYGESIVFPSIVAACKTYSIGDKFLIPRLQLKSAAFIKASTMDEENFWGIIECGLLPHNTIVEEQFLSFIQLNANKLIKCKEFLYVPEYILMIFLRMETMEVSEYELLLSVTEWCLKGIREDPQFKTQKQLFIPFLQYIRFTVLTTREFCLFTERFPNVLDDSTNLKILKHLNDPSKYDLPVWCSNHKVVRKFPKLPAKQELPPLRTQVHARSTHNIRTIRPNH